MRKISSHGFEKAKVCSHRAVEQGTLRWTPRQFSGCGYTAGCGLWQAHE